jgi:hypothetical protein
MKRLLCLILVLVCVAPALALDDQEVDKYIQDLKNADPAVRAKAAFELGCG